MVAAAVHAGGLGDNHSVGVIGGRARRDQAIHPLMRPVHLRLDRAADGRCCRHHAAASRLHLLAGVPMILSIASGSEPSGAFHPVAAPNVSSEAGAESIGTATMEPDGTILLQLRATGPGITGDALLRYRPGENGYDAVRRHLPTLRPGTTVTVPPFG